jgi:Flp pilus assembly protein TadB
VITEAEPSYDEQFRARRKRYMIMMGMRVPFLILATLLYQTPWLAIIVIAISIPLPWMAVLIANDRPARKRSKPVPGTINYQQGLAPGGREIVDSAPDPVTSHRPDHQR